MSHDADRPGPGESPPSPQGPAGESSFEQALTIPAGELRTITVGAAGPIPSAPTGTGPETIGRYRILGKLGEGGMGIVYEAEQQDPRRRVALKVVRGGRFVDEAAIRMFRREAETLARLRHPNIGAIYESGRTEDGQHFFAMELVLGDNLDAFLAKRPQTVTPQEVRFRLALFRRIAEAVHYAHQRGVIHRDLKPSNIIVTQAEGSEGSVTTFSGVRLPEVKILDFGLARITEGDVQLTMATEVGVIKGTLPYMSPEQARGHTEAIDVRTDVYALGVILYEMLAGSRPYDVSRASLIEAVRMICEEPPRSLRSTISGTRRLDPDIETIVGKALEKDADRRYASAAAMAEDVERYLASQPILARPPSTLYQLRKFAGRNRALVAGVAATFVMLVAGVLVSSMQAVRATRAEALATSRMARAESAEALALVRRREADQARTLAEERRAEAETQRTAAVRERFAAVRARTAAERERQVAEEARSAEAAQRQAAEASGERARMEAAKAGAINRFLQDMLASSDPWAGGGGRVTLDAALGRAQARIESSTGTDPEVDYALRGTLASAFAGVGRYAEAETLLRGGIERLGGEREARPALAAGLQCELGGILVQTARYDQAEQQFRQALARQALAGDAAGDTAALIMGQVAAALAYEGRYAQADTMARGALDLAYRGGAGASLAAPGILMTRASIEAGWRENYADADSLLRVSLGLLAVHSGDHAAETAAALEELAGIRVRTGDLAGADSLYGEALALRHQSLGDGRPRVAGAAVSPGGSPPRSGRPDQVVDVLQQVLADRQQGAGPESVPVGRAWTSLGSVYAQAGRLGESETAFETGLGILRKRLGERHPDVATALGDFADLRLRQGRLNDAEKLARECLSIRMERLGPGSPATVASQVSLADILRTRRSKKTYPEAEGLLIAARTEATAARGANDPEALEATRVLVRLYDDWRRPEESAKWSAALSPGQPPAARASSR